ALQQLPVGTGLAPPRTSSEGLITGRPGRYLGDAPAAHAYLIDTTARRVTHVKECPYSKVAIFCAAQARPHTRRGAGSRSPGAPSRLEAVDQAMKPFAMASCRSPQTKEPMPETRLLMLPRKPEKTSTMPSSPSASPTEPSSMPMVFSLRDRWPGQSRGQSVQ